VPQAAPKVPPAQNPIEELLGKQFDVVFSRLVRIASVVCPRCDPENIAADAVVKAWKARARFEPGADPWPWLYAITRNTAIDAGKRVADLPRSHSPIPPGLASPADVEHEVAAREIAEVLRSVVEALPPGQRSALRRLLDPTQGQLPKGFEENRDNVLRAVTGALREMLGAERSTAFLIRLLKLYRERFFDTKD
jgi:RNA polymerase sigma factor (sigma-70 family)